MPGGYCVDAVMVEEACAVQGCACCKEGVVTLEEDRADARAASCVADVSHVVTRSCSCNVDGSDVETAGSSHSAVKSNFQVNYLYISVKCP